MVRRQQMLSRALALNFAVCSFPSNDIDRKSHLSIPPLGNYCKAVAATLTVYLDSLTSINLSFRFFPGRLHRISTVYHFALIRICSQRLSAYASLRMSKMISSFTRRCYMTIENRVMFESIQGRNRSTVFSFFEINYSEVWNVIHLVERFSA